MSQQVELGGVNESTASGARIVLVDDRGVVFITYTRSDPWRLGSVRRPGDLVVLVRGRTGCYLAARCWVLPDEDIALAASAPA